MPHPLQKFAFTLPADLSTDVGLGPQSDRDRSMKAVAALLGAMIVGIDAETEGSEVRVTFHLSPPEAVATGHKMLWQPDGSEFCGRVIGPRYDPPPLRPWAAAVEKDTDERLARSLHPLTSPSGTRSGPDHQDPKGESDAE